MNEIVPVGTSGGNVLMPRSIDEAMRLADLMAKAKMVPKHLQGDVGTCFMVVEQALRWQMSPFAVAQCTSSIGGKLMYEGKLVAAAATSCGAIIGEFDYEFAGDPMKPETLSVTARATRASDNQVRAMTLKWIDAKTDNQFWRKQPEQQLSYAVARVWCRRWSPGVILGVFAPEEFDRSGPKDGFVGTTIDVEITPETENRPATAKPNSNGETPEQREAKQRAWMDKLELDLAHAVAEGGEAVDGILARPDVVAAQDRARGAARDRLNGMIADAIARTAASETSAPNEEPEGEVHAGVFADPNDDPFRERVPA